MLLEFPSHGGAGETLSRHCIKAAFVGAGIGGPAPSPGAEPEPNPPLGGGETSPQPHRKPDPGTARGRRIRFPPILRNTWKP